MIKTKDLSVTTVGNVVIYRSVSYTHLDVYKRQVLSSAIEKSLYPVVMRYAFMVSTN